MSRGYQFVIASIIGVAAASGILTWSVYPEAPRLTGNAAFQEQNPVYRAGGADCAAAEFSKARSRIRALRAIACQEAEEQHRLAANDLIQQRRAADAADASAILTYQQTKIAALGVFLGFVTMAAAIAAAWFARRAAVATEETVTLAKEGSDGAAQALIIAARNADASTQQVAIAASTAERQLRAYIDAETAIIVGELAPGRQGNFVELFAYNRGVTPAIDVVVRCQLIVGARKEFENNWRINPYGEEISKAPLAPNARIPLRIPIPTFSKGMVDKLQSGKTHIWFAGVIMYKDVFGVSRLTRFSCVLLPTRMQGRFIVHTLANGNEMT
ncbi:hypothetical protein [Sphingobium yanoikuyae]|uniref:hypothetical protein n=1 Tax=Sphingobium yanoikuyae TaxID=13690 RepID=UPI00289D2681|nr:hypothetical protein [Sphingobium yanoikuyae]